MFQFMHLQVLSLEDSLHACSTQAPVSEGHVFVEIGCNNSTLSLHGARHTVGVPSVEWWCDFSVKCLPINFCVWTLGLHLVALFWKVVELLWGRVTIDEINYLGGQWNLIGWAFPLSDFHFLTMDTMWSAANALTDIPSPTMVNYTLKLWPRIAFHLFSNFFSGICHGNKKPTDEQWPRMASGLIHLVPFYLIWKSSLSIPCPLSWARSAFSTS